MSGGAVGYPALVARLSAARRFGVRLDLDRVRAALDRLGDPARRLPAVVQIGGTNGKGSTAAFVEAIARAGGRRTGLYTSPHLSRFAERFRVDGAELSREALAEIGAEVVADDDRAGGELTFFELATVMAVVGFARAGVEVAVLEVGMGGRLDATTAVGADVAAVTGVALDHQAYLGDTLAAIAGEKAGIFRAGQRAVVGAAGEPEAVPWLVDAARAAGVAALAVVDDAAIAAAAARPRGLAGPHQARNAACALLVVDALGEVLGRPIDEAARTGGLAAARLPGRMEAVTAGGARYLLDGAHNPQAAAVLAAALGERAGGGGGRVVVLGTSADKDVDGLVTPLVADARAVVVCESKSERAAPRATLAAAVRRRFAGPVVVATDVADALERAAALAGDGEVVVTGSLFVVGEAREALLGEPSDAAAGDAPLSDPVSAPASRRPGPVR